MHRIANAIVLYCMQLTNRGVSLRKARIRKGREGCEADADGLRRCLDLARPLRLFAAYRGLSRLIAAYRGTQRALHSQSAGLVSRRGVVPRGGGLVLDIFQWWAGP